MDAQRTIFDPISTQHGSKLLAAARQHIAELDALDRESGFSQVPPRGWVPLYLRTAISAISAGIDGKRWDCVAEGMVMIQELEAAVRPK